MPPGFLVVSGQMGAYLQAEAQDQHGRMLCSPGNLLGWGYLYFPTRDS